jgi:hypothetical protein
MLRRRKNIINIAVKSKKLNLKMNLVMAVMAVMAGQALAELAEVDLPVTVVTVQLETAALRGLLVQPMAAAAEVPAMAATAETAEMRMHLQQAVTPMAVLAVLLRAVAPQAAI